MDDKDAAIEDPMDLEGGSAADEAGPSESERIKLDSSPVPPGEEDPDAGEDGAPADAKRVGKKEVAAIQGERGRLARGSS
jgi:hypothetical protein